MREQMISSAVGMLKEHGFTVTAFLHTNTCFDVVARKQDITLLLKFFENADALRPEQALELRKLASIFKSTAIVIGSKTKAFSLQDNIIYSRYGISTVAPKTLENFLEGNVPSIKCFKGKEIVELDYDKIKKLRSEMGISVRELAERIGSTVESVYRYEHGAKASLLAAEEIEHALDSDVIKSIDLFEAEEKEFTAEEPEDESLLKIQSLGSKIVTFRKAPFGAISASDEKILIEKGSSKSEIKRKALELEKTRAPFESFPVVLAKKSSDKAVGRTAVVEEEELSSLSRFKELVELIQEREKLNE